MTPIDWTAVSGTLFLIIGGSVNWLIPGVRRLMVPLAAHGSDGGDRRAEARDFGTMLERLGNLAELNEKAQQNAAEDRERIGDALRALGAQSAEQTKVLANLVKITDATLVASTANSKILQALEEAGALDAIAHVLKPRRPRTGHDRRRRSA